mmetsp:Transcript_6314/g.7324  ORF Transcript_6314/g.7324 Transcript_6314/m.7324 type:complete len:90 (-) Transcript_6314:332-601(-)
MKLNIMNPNGICPVALIPTVVLNHDNKNSRLLTRSSRYPNWIIQYQASFTTDPNSRSIILFTSRSIGDYILHTCRKLTWVRLHYEFVSA